MQVTRRWLNYDGDNVALHLAQLLQNTDKFYCDFLQRTEGKQVDSDETVCEGNDAPLARASSLLEEAFPSVVSSGHVRHERPL